MKRRECIAVIGSALIVWPLAAPAQPGGKIWRIGYLSSRYGPTELSQSFLQGLRELGYVEGKNLVVELRVAEGKNERLAELAADLIRIGVDIIVTEGTPSTIAAMKTTRTIPIVFGSTQDPVEKGIVASLAHPGGNVTGMALIADDAKPLQLLKEAAPGTSRIAFIYDPATRPGPYGEAAIRALQKNARTLDMTLQAVALRDPAETDQVFTKLPAGTNGLLIENSAINLMAEARICELALQNRLPAVATLHEFAKAGCLMSYGENLPDIYRRAAGYVDKILRGAKPSDLPVMQATVFDLLINVKTAKALGLNIPASLIAGAAEVIN